MFFFCTSKKCDLGRWQRCTPENQTLQFLRSGMDRDANLEMQQPPENVVQLLVYFYLLIYFLTKRTKRKHQPANKALLEAKQDTGEQDLVMQHSKETS